MQPLAKLPTAIEGFDRISEGGLPRQRTTLLIGGPGAGKTVFALQCLINAARQHRTAGIFVAFEESPRQIIAAGQAEADVRRVVGLLKKNEYKRRQAPVGIRVSPSGFGKDWRYPITFRYNDEY